MGDMITGVAAGIGTQGDRRVGCVAHPPDPGEFMTQFAQPALITTVHDPEGRLLPRLHRSCASLGWYAGVYAFATEVTDGAVIDALRAAEASVVVGELGIPGSAQRQLLAAAMDDGHAEVLCCDFDRWLHWVGTYPDELAGLRDRLRSACPEAWYVCLGRTERAFATHPATQILPETATNRALMAVAGMDLDATAGAAWIRVEGARLIVAGSTCASKATDLEWPGLVLQAGGRQRLRGVQLEGLEFETPDAYRDEIAAAGSLAAWMAATYDRPQVMLERLQLATDSVEALIRVTGPT